MVGATASPASRTSFPASAISSSPSRRKERPRRAGARPRPRLRNPARRHQALAGRRADTGAAARAARPDRSSTASRPTTSKSSSRACPTRNSKSSTTATCPTSRVQHLLAVMLHDGNVTFKSAHDFRRMNDPQGAGAASAHRSRRRPGLTDAQRRWRCVMEIRLKDGRMLHHQTMAAKGSFENPLTPRRGRRESARPDRADPGQRAAEALLAALWNFEQDQGRARAAQAVPEVKSERA